MVTQTEKEEVILLHSEELKALLNAIRQPPPPPAAPAPPPQPVPLSHAYGFD